MKNFFGLSSLALLALVGCSTYRPTSTSVAMNEPVMSQEAYAEWSKPFEAPAIETTRKPSSEVVGKIQHVWEADTIRVAMSQNTTLNKSFNVRFNQYAVYTTREQVGVRVQRYVTVRWDEVSQPVVICAGDATEGAGKSALWNKFYGAPKAKKAKALAEAIVGIGESSAQSLIDAGYFHSKPRSWSEFAGVIHQAKSSRVINENAEYDTLYKYRSENMANLGYDTTVVGICHTEVERYYQPVQELRWVTEMQWQDVPHKELIDTDVRAYQVVVTGPRLQSFETETLVIHMHRDLGNYSFSVDGDYYTNYTRSFDGRKITLTGVSRKFIPLPSDIFASQGSVEVSNGQGGFVTAINQKYIPKTAADGKLLISIEVSSCKRGALNKNSCALLGGKKTVVVKTVLEVDKTGIVRFTFPRDATKYHSVKFWINAAGSPWYANNVVNGPNHPGL